MSNGWSSEDYGSSPVISGIVTDQVITRGSGFRISAGGAINGLVIKIKCSGVTVVGEITAKLQTAIGQDWVDSKTVSITAAGDFYIKLLGAKAADQTYLPLLNQGRVVISSTNAGDAATIVSVDLLGEL